MNRKRTFNNKSRIEKIIDPDSLSKDYLSEGEVEKPSGFIFFDAELT